VLPQVDTANPQGRYNSRESGLERRFQIRHEHIDAAG
jgi:hypothetical protein